MEIRVGEQHKVLQAIAPIVGGPTARKLITAATSQKKTDMKAAQDAFEKVPEADRRKLMSTLETIEKDNTVAQKIVQDVARPRIPQKKTQVRW